MGEYPTLVGLYSTHAYGIKVYLVLKVIYIIRKNINNMVTIYTSSETISYSFK